MRTDFKPSPARLGPAGRLLAAAGAAWTLLAAPSPATSQPAAAAVPSLRAPDLQRTRLQNGLRIVIHSDPSSPTVAAALSYGFGARDEPRGGAGSSRVLARLMHGRSGGPRGAPIRSRGGASGFETDARRTVHWVVLPSNEVSLALWSLADGTRPASFTDSDVRAAVGELRRRRRARLARPFERGRLRLRQLAFEGSPSLARAGRVDDETGAKIAALRKRFYTPSNAVLAVVGDVDADRVVLLARRYLGSAAAKGAPRPDRALPPPPQSSERFSSIEDAAATSPGLAVGWRVSEAARRELAALDLTAEILGFGRASALATRLGGLARRVEVSAGSPGSSLFSVLVMLAPNGSLARVEQILRDEIARLGRAGPTRRELDRARARWVTRLAVALDSNESRAKLLGLHELGGDARRIGRALDTHRSVERSDVRKAVAKYLGEQARVVVEIRPPGPGQEAAPKMRKAKKRAGRPVPRRRARRRR